MRFTALVAKVGISVLRCIGDTYLGSKPMISYLPSTIVLMDFPRPTIATDPDPPGPCRYVSGRENNFIGPTPGLNKIDPSRWSVETVAGYLRKNIDTVELLFGLVYYM